MMSVLMNLGDTESSTEATAAGNTESRAVALQKIRDIVAAHESIVVLEHEKPDGDCIGSGLGLVLGLQMMGKKALLVSQDPHPPVYDFLPGRAFHTRAGYLEPGDFSPEVAIFVDCTGPDRVGKARELAEGKVWVNIDHHISNSNFGHINLVDPEASASGELVMELLETLGVPLTQDIGTCLYVAIVTDTGGFRYQNTSAKTMRLAAKLLDIGVKASEVADQVFETRSLSSLLLLKAALGTLKIYQNGRLAAVTVTREMLRSAGASPDESDGIINYPRSIAGVEVAVCFKETEDGRGVHVSFRSRSRVDVAKIASSLGGGGHPRASGALIPGSIEEVSGKVLGMLNNLDVWTDL
ncbi:MAG TPA: bifunctional oligoribonuclease/PAP phosphatase NrnA [Firmicutes bacterium]|nr:bifunctional oligoribonuclease/PAP phosphatase NrnA [Candidatus Fermentithermobacillaceae bacterium]